MIVMRSSRYAGRAGSVKTKHLLCLIYYKNVLHRNFHNLLWIAPHGTSAVSDVGSGCMMVVKLTVGLNS